MIVKTILHMADLHLGAKNLKLPSDKQKILAQEHIQALAEVFSQPCDIVLVCGDLFHSNFVSSKLKKAFWQQVENFAKPVLYVKGNHDERAMLSDAPANFHILDESNKVFRTENVDFWCASQNYKDFDKSKKNVLLLHGSVSNKTDNDYLEIEKLLTEKFDYVALGHEHSFWQGQSGQTTLAYSGALFANGFDECGQKGYIIVNEDFKPHFQPLAQRNFKILDFSISDICDMQQLKEELKKLVSGQKQNIIRVVLRGYYQEGQEFDFDKLGSDYQGFYIEFVDKTKIKIDLEKYKNEVLSFKAEFIKLVEESELSEEDKNKILRIGIEALQGDDLSI